LSRLVLIPGIKDYSTNYCLQRQFKVTFHPSSLWTIITETCIFNATVLLTISSETTRRRVCKTLSHCAFAHCMVKLRPGAEKTGVLMFYLKWELCCFGTRKEIHLGRIVSLQS
jgi:hypothetical protein